MLTSESTFEKQFQAIYEYKPTLPDELKEEHWKDHKKKLDKTGVFQSLKSIENKLDEYETNKTSVSKRIKYLEKIAENIEDNKKELESIEERMSSSFSNKTLVALVGLIDEVGKFSVSIHDDTVILKKYKKQIAKIGKETTKILNAKKLEKVLDVFCQINFLGDYSFIKELNGPDELETYIQKYVFKDATEFSNLDDDVIIDILNLKKRPSKLAFSEDIKKYIRDNEDTIKEKLKCEARKTLDDPFARFLGIISLRSSDDDIQKIIKEL